MSLLSSASAWTNDEPKKRTSTIRKTIKNVQFNDIQKDKINDPNNIIEYITGVNDEGPITKFYSLLDIIPKNKNNFLLVADDDVFYPKSRIRDIKKYTTNS